MAKVRLDKRTGWWIADYRTANGVRVQRKAGRTKVQAEAVLRKILDEVGQEVVYGTAAVKQVIFDDFKTEYLAYSEKNKRPGSASRDATSCRQLLEEFRGRRLITITSKDVQKHKDRRSTEVSQASVNRELACLKNMFNKAIQWGYAKENPVKTVKLFRENNARVRFLSPQERDNLLIKCHESIRPVILFALHSGMRKSEILNLTWNDVDLDRSSIRIRESKNGHQRFVPINSALHEVLQGLSRLRSLEDPRVFWNLVNLRKLWEAALVLAKISDFRFHDLRHTFASYMVMAGADLKTLQEIMGHKSFVMTLRYSHLSASHKQAAVERLANAMKGEIPVSGVPANGDATQAQHAADKAV